MAIRYCAAPADAGDTDPPEVLDLMHRVTIIPMVRRTLFGPRITVFTKDGNSYTKEGTGREFIWDFEEHVRRMQPVASGPAISTARFGELIDNVPQPGSRRKSCRATADRADDPGLTTRPRALVAGH